MKMTSSTTKVLISIIMALSLGFGAESLVGEAIACEFSEQGWEIPNLKGLKAELVGNTENDGKTYKREAFILDNTIFVARMSCEGNIFTYVFDQNMDGKIDFWIVDGDGDGIFETLCYPGDETFIPEWVKK